MIHAGPDLLDFLADLELAVLPDHITVGTTFSLRPMLDMDARIHLCTLCRYTCTCPTTAARHRCPPTKDP